MASSLKVKGHEKYGGRTKGKNAVFENRLTIDDVGSLKTTSTLSDGAKLFGVTEGVFSRWLRDETIPRCGRKIGGRWYLSTRKLLAILEGEEL